MSYKGRFIRTVAIAGVIACATSTAIGQTATPATGLGPLWKNAADLSVNPQWHAYAVVLNGIKYIRIDDQNGVTHALVGVADGTPFVAPAGVDALNVSTSTSPSTSSATDAAPAQQVYNDGSTTVTETPQTDGTTKFNVMSVDTCKNGSCSGGGGA